MKYQSYVLVAATSFSSTAFSAVISGAIFQAGSTAAEYTAAGFTNANPSGALVSYAQACNGYPFGCTTTVTPSGPLANKGFYQFQFFDWNAYNYSGLFSAMAINYGTSGMNNAQVIAEVNYQSGLTGLTATTAALAGDAHCRFVDFLPTDLDNSIVLNWFPANMPTTPGLSQVFTFAWDLTVIEPPSFMSNGLSVGAVGSLPSPGAIALMGLAGVVGGRRRRA